MPGVPPGGYPHSPGLLIGREGPKENPREAVPPGGRSARVVGAGYFATLTPWRNS